MVVYLHNYVVVYAVNFSMWSGRYFLHQCFKDRFVLELKPVSFIHLLLRKSTCHSVSPFYPSRAEVFVRTKFSFLSSPPLPSPPFPTKAEAEVLMKKTFFFLRAMLLVEVYSGLPLISSPLILTQTDTYPQSSEKQGNMSSTFTIFFFSMFVTGLQIGFFKKKICLSMQII